MTSDHHGRDGRGPAHAATLIVDNIPGLVALLTASGEVATVNRQLFDYFGRPLDELRRWTTNDIVHPDDRPHVVDVFSRSIASGTPCETTQRFRRADGVYRWFTNWSTGARATRAMGASLLHAHPDARAAARFAATTAAPRAGACC